MTKETKTFAIDADAIRELAALMEETGLTEIEVSEGGARDSRRVRSNGRLRRARASCGASGPGVSAGRGGARRPGGYQRANAGRRHLADGRHRLYAPRSVLATFC